MNDNSKNLYTKQNFIDVQEMNEQEKKGIDKMVDLVISNIYDGNIENNEEFKKLNRQIGIAYNAMKDQFAETLRDDGERYFEHLRAVTNIVLEFISNPNKEKVLIALLHDAIEDTDIDFHVLNKLFGPKIAIAVVGLSKKDWEDYVETIDTFKIYDEIRIENKLDIDDLDEIKVIYDGVIGERMKDLGKKRRNEEYFGHLKSFDSMLEGVKEIYIENNTKDLSEGELIEITKNIIDVKLADRIHNLSTQWDENNTEKTIRKIEETKKYFLGIAKETNPLAYEKLKTLILNLELKLADFNKKIDNIVK